MSSTMPWPDVGEELVHFEDYLAFAPRWRDQVANMRIHETTRERPVDRFGHERSLLRKLPAIPFDSDESCGRRRQSHARIEFDGNRYSTPPGLARRPVTIRANRDELRVLHEGQVVAPACRCYQRGQLIFSPDHPAGGAGAAATIAKLALEHEFDALGPEARQFHLHLRSQPVKTSVHLRRLLGLARLYGPTELLSAIARAPGVGNLTTPPMSRTCCWPGGDVGNCPRPRYPRPGRRELIDEIELEPADPALYDRFASTPRETLMLDVTTISRRGWNVTWPS